MVKNFLLILSLQLFTTQLLLSGENKGAQFYLVHPKVLSKTITVGGSKADISAFSSRAIQIAVDALVVHGGGSVKLMPG
jgi:hypothetical protein